MYDDEEEMTHARIPRFVVAAIEAIFPMTFETRALIWIATNKKT